jgi:hypothetical protein
MPSRKLLDEVVTLLLDYGDLSRSPLQNAPQTTSLQR